VPIHRTIITVDVEGYTKRTNVERGLVREDLYKIFGRGLVDSGITEELREPLVDLGDGVMAFIRPADTLPKTRLITTFVPLLRELLEAHASDSPARQFRLRVAMHAGDVLGDSRGIYGENVDLTCRLVDAPELRDQLTSTSDRLVLAVSEHIYQSVIWHGYDGIDARNFQQLINLSIGDQKHLGWIEVPREA
jgi:class 3 adenylate cyclase